MRRAAVGSEALGVTTALTIGSLIADAVGLHDEIGILSIYVGIDPVAEATARPPWEIELDAELQLLRARMRAQGRERWTAFDHCLDALAPALTRLVDATEHGRGRALFAAVDSREVHTVAAQTRFATKTTLGTVAHVIPLLRVDEGHPVGLVLVGRDRVRMLETRLGEVVECVTFDVEPVVLDGPERKGPSAANPLRAQQTVAHRERYERHLEVEHRRRLVDAAEQIARTAVRRGWEIAAVAGDARGTQPLAEALAAAAVEVELVHRDLAESQPARALAELEPALHAARSRRDLALALKARDAASSGGRGAIGLGDVLGALAEGRVDRLLLDGERQFTGAASASGELFPAGILPAGLAGTELEPEPLLADRMAVQALGTRARVTVVGGEAAAVLANADGVAALLRW